MADMNRMLLRAAQRASSTSTEVKTRALPRFIPVDDPRFEIKSTLDAHVEEEEGKAQVIGRIKLSDEYLNRARKASREADRKAKGNPCTK
jgi:hypothetical protein